LEQKATSRIGAIIHHTDADGILWVLFHEALPKRCERTDEMLKKSWLVLKAAWTTSYPMGDVRRYAYGKYGIAHSHLIEGKVLVDESSRMWILVQCNGKYSWSDEERHAKIDRWTDIGWYSAETIQDILQDMRKDVIGELKQIFELAAEQDEQFVPMRDAFQAA